MTIKYLLLLGLSVLLAACTSSPYKPAKSSEGIGYQERQLAEGRWRINFRLGNSNMADAQDYALLRASELTQQKGFDWFEVVNRDTETSGKDRSGVSVGVGYGVGRRCGALGCGSGLGLGVGLGNDDRAYSIAIMEIVMGKGKMKEGTNVYNAKEVASTLRPSMIKEK